ncbi:hypothetical protein BCR44DRAFT_42339 [Catenaria anguillulae PL171]|uniref:Uncharacterized protein n=1 Tax=Catenaria anguillulae PL171 TaxID=765915 RepID=A0A1Y2HG07_9FUNG|nr:hypothetical protein BCR44DRAFT_42339 [Catenaria anguillulae PL171]
MHSAHITQDSPSRPLVPSSLATLPFDVQSAIARHSDLISIAQLHCTCRAFANPALYSSISDVRILQAVTAGDNSAFCQALSASSDLTAKPPTWPTEADLIHYDRRRQLFQACVWHLVCTHNEPSSVWWAPLDLLYDVTKVYLRELDHLDKANGVGQSITDIAVLKGLDQIETDTQRFLERMLDVAVSRRHSIGLTSLSTFCVRNKAWLESLDLFGTLMTLTKATDVPAPQLVDMQLALSPFTWFGNEGGDACECASEWLAASGHPLVLLNGVRLFAKNGNDSLSATLYCLPDLVYALWTAGRKNLTLQFLDLFLLALGTHSVRYFAFREADADPLLWAMGQHVTRPKKALPLKFPADQDADSVEPSVFRPFILAGASQDLIRAAIASLRGWNWYDMDSWFQLKENPYSPVDRELLDWYLVRKPLHLDLVHAYSHRLATSLRAACSKVSGRALQRVLEEVPFDLVHAREITDTKYPTKCDRCEQLKQLANQPGAPALLKRFVKQYDEASPMSFVPIPAHKRLQEARAIQALLKSIPPRSAASAASKTGDSHSWRAYLDSFVAQRTSYGNSLLPLLWPHVRDANRYPDTALNVIPFGEFMRAMIQGHWLPEAIQVLDEAKGIERCSSWRISMQEMVGLMAPDKRELAHRLTAESVEEVVDFMRENGWLAVEA